MPAAPKESSRARLIMAPWAIGDWLVDGKSHYGDGLYERAADILEIDNNQLRHYKALSECYELCLRKHNLTWSLHKEVAFIKKPVKDKKGRMSWGEEHDMQVAALKKVPDVGKMSWG